MAERKFLFMSSDGFSEEAAQADTITLGGLTMGGNVAMGTHKVTGMGAAAVNNDALAFGQSNANLAGLDIDTAALTMNDQKITGMGAGAADGDALAYGQSSANLAGLAIDTNDLTMSFKKITGLGAAAADGDALAFGQGSANLAGLDIDTAALTMGDQKITGLGSAAANGDALAYGQSGANLAGLDIDTAALAMNSQKITGLGAGASDGDALAYGQGSANLAGLAIDTAALTMDSQKITGLGAGTAAGDAVNKAQLDAAVISGGTLKEALLHEDQVSDAEGVLAAVALVIATNPVAGDVITLTDGTTTRGYGAASGGDVQYDIGGTPAATMTNLVAAIEADAAAIWGAAFSTDLGGIDDGVVVIIEDDNDGDASKVWGVWGTQADCQIVDFGGENDYTSKTTENLPGTLPGSTNFGVNRTTNDLIDGELHDVLNNDTIYGWDENGLAWNYMSGGSSIPDATGAAGGGVKGKATYDTDYGLAVASGVVKLNIAASKGLDYSFGALEIKIDNTPNTLSADADGLKVAGLPSLFKINGSAVGASVTTANLDDVLDGSDADALHTHTDTSVTVTHASTTGQTANDHHNQSHVLTGGDHTVSGLTIGDVLTATGAASFDWQTPSPATDAEHLVNALPAVEAVTKADPVYASSTANKFGKADADTDAKAWVFGIAAANIAQDATGNIISYGIAPGVLSGATPGAGYYLGSGGGLSTSVPGAGKRVILIGWAFNATDLWVQPTDFGKAAA